METHHFSCACYSDEHTLRFTLDEDDPPYLTASTFLNTSWMPWYQRLWVGIKYIFGYKAKYGHFDCFLLSSDDTERFYELAKKVYEIEKNKK